MVQCIEFFAKTLAGREKMKRILITGFIVFSLMVLFVSVGRAELKDGLILYLTFDAVSGDTVKDDSGNGNDGQIQAKAKMVAGKFGKGIELDGTTQFVLVPHNDNMDTAKAITIAAWINPAKPAASCWLYYLISKWNYHAGNGRCYCLALLDKAGITFRFSKDGTDAGETAASGGVLEYGKNSWQHVAGVYDGKESRAYINGEEAAKVAVVKEIFADKADGISIGAGSYGKEAAARFTGIVDDVAIYNRALSVNEIKQLMQGPIGFAVNSIGKLATTWGDIK
jgi:hypothetical protein